MTEKNQPSTEVIMLASKSVDNNVDTINKNLDILLKSSELTVSIVSETMLALKELDFNMKKLEYSYELMMKNADKSMELIQYGAKQSERWMLQIDKVLDRVLEIDLTTNNENLIQSRTELLKLLNSQMEVLLRLQMSIFNC